ncbi:MAG: hypothetical protein DWQ04_16420 [Chloroflexi bacterium]|nr:MAG: hypothetical protein DWQ04_16420 [Chloroflexota bacterium]
MIFGPVDRFNKLNFMAFTQCLYFDKPPWTPSNMHVELTNPTKGSPKFGIIVVAICVVYKLDVRV